MSFKEKLFGTAQTMEEHGEQALNNVAEFSDQGKSKVVRDLRAVINDAQSLLRKAENQKRATTSELADVPDDGIAVLRKRFASAHAALDAKAHDAGEAADRYIRQNPWQSVGIASAASFCVAVLIVGASMAPYLKKFGDR